MLRYKAGDQMLTPNLYNFVTSFPDCLEETFYILAQIQDIFSSKFIQGLKTDLAPNSFVKDVNLSVISSMISSVN